MKKTFSVLMALMLALAIFCGTAFADAADYTGEWYLTSIEMGDIAMSPDMLGFEMILTLNADGTVEMYANDGEKPETDAGTWTAAGDMVDITIDGDTESLVPVDDTLIMDMADEGRMTFSREAAAAAYAPAPARVIEDVAEYDGVWNMAFAETNGIQLPAEFFADVPNMPMQSFSIAGGMVTLDGTDVGAIEAALTDGILVLPLAEGTEDAMTLPFTLYEDGMMSCTVEDGENVVVFYYAPAAEE